MTPEKKFLKDYVPSPFRIEAVELAFDLDENRTVVRNELTLKRTSSTDRSPLVLDGIGLELLSLHCDQRPLPPSQYSVTAETLVVRDLPGECVLTIENTTNPGANTSLEGLYISRGRISTQCEPEGFRKITYFIDRPDIMSRYKVKITADKKRYPLLLSNGNAIGQGDLPGGKHWVMWDDPFHKPCYLFALVAGAFAVLDDTHRTPSGRDIRLSIYAEPSHIGRCAHAMASLKRAMKWDEDEFGLECDLEHYKIVAVSDFNMGAMENKGLNIFNTALVLADAETAKDEAFLDIENVIGHEYFHNWTGNRVTCRDWFQLCLKEGLTVFRDQEFSQDVGPYAPTRIKSIDFLRRQQFTEDEGPMAHAPRPDSYVEINNFYSATVYHKGAEIVRMLRTLIGKAAFRKGMDLYFKRHDGQAVTQEDFVQAMADASGRDLTQFMYWYTRVGTPRISWHGAYDAAKQAYTLTLEQHTPKAHALAETAVLHIPVDLALLSPDGDEQVVQLAGSKASPSTGVLIELRKERESFIFTGVKQKPTPSLFRGFSAPVRVENTFNDQDLCFLFAKDRDPFNRWDAGQQLFTRTILSLVQGVQAGTALSIGAHVTNAFKHVLSSDGIDLAQRALLLSVPNEATIAQEMRPIDVSALAQARNHLLHTLAQSARSELKACFERYRTIAAFDLSPEAMGQRSFKGACLFFLSQLREADTLRIIVEQFEQSRNMSECEGALRRLSEWDCPEQATALDQFYKKWQHDDLVIDQWFALQARSQLPGTLERVKQLLQHPAYNERNPNRLRSLVGAYCRYNFVRFHDPDGASYRLCANQVTHIDALNPQMGAALARCFHMWRRFDAKQQSLCEPVLRDLAKQTNLSKDVQEVVSRLLAAEV